MSVENNKSDNKSGDSFQPPNLPVAWIASTFIGPILVVVLPKFFSSEGTTFTTSLIIALVLLSVSLLVICFAVVLKLYDESYARQIILFNLNILEKNIEVMEKNEISNDKKYKELLELQENILLKIKQAENTEQ